LNTCCREGLKKLLVVVLAAFFGSALVFAQNVETQVGADKSVVSSRQSVSTTNADTAWRPSSEQLASINAVTRAYFAALDANKAVDAYAFSSPRQKQYVPYDMFQKMLEDFNSEAGPVVARHIRAVTWYKDTPQTGPGLYVAVDYSSDFTNLALHCGYVVWHEQSDRTFLLTREEVNMIDNATMAKLKPGDLEKVRGQFRC